MLQSHERDRQVHQQEHKYKEVFIGKHCVFRGPHSSQTLIPVHPPDTVSLMFLKLTFSTLVILASLHHAQGLPAPERLAKRNNDGGGKPAPYAGWSDNSDPTELINELYAAKNPNVANALMPADGYIYRFLGERASTLPS